MCGSNFCNCSEHSDYNNGKNQTHPVIVWPGWQDNDARYSVQTDVNPVPISPVHFQSWPGIQVQLLNGWELTNYGKISVPYNSYLQKAGGGSATYPKAPKPLPGQGYQPQGNNPPSQIQLTNQMMAQTNQQGMGFTGALGPGVQEALAGRRYYG